ncbi:MAG: DUF420 domain-containing protein, partial [Bacteroidia bacterium]|nr:DUF420 domain-containing protein [Bacteroidia bacterium]
MNLENEKKYNKWVAVLSILIPIVVAALFGVKIDVELPVFLPPIYATTNALTAFILVLAFLAIRNKNIKLHKLLTTSAIILSALFLVMYVAYHMTSDSTKFGGEGIIKYIYF